MKKKPNAVFLNLIFIFLIAKSLFIDHCDSCDEDGPTLPDVIVPIFVNLQVVKEKPLQMDVSQAITFSSVVESLKATSLTLHTFFKLKSLDYGAITIKFVNCFPTKLW